VRNELGARVCVEEIPQPTETSAIRDDGRRVMIFRDGTTKLS